MSWWFPNFEWAKKRSTKLTLNNTKVLREVSCGLVDRSLLPKN